MNVVLTIFTIFTLFQTVYSLESWQENYKGAYYVLPTLLIFSIVFGVLIILAIVVAVVFTVREKMNKNEPVNQSSVNHQMNEIIDINQQMNDKDSTKIHSVDKDEKDDE